MFFLLASKAICEEYNFCFKNKDNTQPCPDSYDVIFMEDFDKWTDKVTPADESKVTLHFMNSLPSGKLISPNNLKYFVKKLVVKGQTKDVSVTLNTSQNFVMVEELELNNTAVTISTTTLACDNITFNNVEIKSLQSGDLTCDALEINGGISTIAAFKKQITATKATINLNQFDLKESVVLDFTDMFVSDFQFTGINANMEWTGLPNMLRMKYADNKNTITFKIHNLQPSIKVEHTVKNVKLTLNEIAAVGVSLIRCIKFTADNSELEFPFSIDSVVNTMTIEAKNKAVIRQGGENLNAVVDGKSYTYIISSSAKEAGSLKLGTEVNIVKEGNEEQKVSISALTKDASDSYQINANTSLLTMNIPSYIVNENTEFGGQGNYRFDSLKVQNVMKVNTLVLDQKSQITIVGNNETTIKANKVKANNATINVEISDDAELGNFDLIKTNSIDCSQVKFVINEVEGNTYQLKKSDVELKCSVTGVEFKVKERVNEKNDKFCIGAGACPKNYTQINDQETFDSWKSMFPAGHKNIHFIIIKDIGDVTTPLVFDFTNLGTDLNVEFESIEMQKQRKLEISSTSFGGIIKTLKVTKTQLGINGNITGKIKLPNLHLIESILDDKFQNNIDRDYQDHYIIEMTLGSKLDFISAYTTDIYLPSSEATIEFEDNQWNIEVLYPTKTEYSIMSLGQKVIIHPEKSSVGKFTLKCMPSSTNIKPLYIDATNSSQVQLQGTWPENFTGIHFINPGNSQFSMNSKTFPATFDFTENSEAVSITTDKNIINITSPIHAYSGINFGGEVAINEIKLSKEGTVQSENSKPISINNLILDENVETRIPSQTSINELNLGKLSKAIFTGSLNKEFPATINMEYSLSSMPYIHADEILREDVKFNFSYVRGTESEINKEQMITLSEIPVRVVCGKKINCESWTSTFTGNETFTPSCTEHSGYKCYELKFIPNYYIDYSLNKAEIAIITIMSIIVVGCIGACIFIGCRTKKEEPFGSSKVDGQLLLENEQIQ